MPFGREILLRNVKCAAARAWIYFISLSALSIKFHNFEEIISLPHEVAISL